MRKVWMLSTLLLLPACARGPVIVTTPPAACHKIVPTSWAAGIPAEPIPRAVDIKEWIGRPFTETMAAAIVAPYAKAYVGADAKQAMSDGRTADAIAIFTNCEELVNASRGDRPK